MGRPIPLTALSALLNSSRLYYLSQLCSHDLVMTQLALLLAHYLMLKVLTEKTNSLTKLADLSLT
jgi:hypothetical protein